MHYFRTAMLYIRVICFEHMAAWKRCDMRKVCGNMFEDRKRRCGTPRCWRCWQESLFFFQEGSVLSIYVTRKLLILYTRSCNFWLASYPQIARSKRSSGSDFPSYLGILATINKTAVCLLPHQMEQVLCSTPVWSPSSTCRYGVALLDYIIWRRLGIMCHKHCQECSVCNCYTSRQ